MEMDIKTAMNNNETAYNVVGEIPGTDPVLKNEIVMIGAHLDSWELGTGATDSGPGSLAVLEAAQHLLRGRDGLLGLLSKTVRSHHGSVTSQKTGMDRRRTSH